jgi:N-acetylmuramoyl-L-alanine amidase
MMTYTVAAGDCIWSIAYENGLYWKTVWDHPQNAELKRQRSSPFLLMPGDVVSVPDLHQSLVSAPSQQRHRFRLKGVPAVVKICVLEPPPDDPPADDTGPDNVDQDQDGAEVLIEELDDQPQQLQPARNRRYESVVDGQVGPSGSTDGDGAIKLSLAPDAREVLLRIEPGTRQERQLRVLLGALDPADMPTGQAQRLANLGYLGDPRPDDDASLAAALESFQKDQGLQTTGQADDQTVDKLKQAHGS